MAGGDALLAPAATGRESVQAPPSGVRDPAWAPQTAGGGFALPPLSGAAPVASGAPPMPAAAPAQAPRPAAPPPMQQLAPVAIALALLPGDRPALRVALEPPELGRVEVRIQRGADGADAVRILVERPETLALLQRDRGELGRALDQAGVGAGSGISLGLAGQETGGGQHGGAQREAGSGGAPGRGPPAPQALAAGPPERSVALLGLLDIAV